MKEISAGDKRTHELLQQLIKEVRKLRRETTVPSTTTDILPVDDMVTTVPAKDTRVADWLKSPAAVKMRERARQIEADYNDPMRVNGRAMAKCKEEKSNQEERHDRRRADPAAAGGTRWSIGNITSEDLLHGADPRRHAPTPRPRCWLPRRLPARITAAIRSWGVGAQLGARCQIPVDRGSEGPGRAQHRRRLAGGAPPASPPWRYGAPGRCRSRSGRLSGGLIGIYLSGGLVGNRPGRPQPESPRG